MAALSLAAVDGTRREASIAKIYQLELKYVVEDKFLEPFATDPEVKVQLAYVILVFVWGVYRTSSRSYLWES